MSTATTLKARLEKLLGVRGDFARHLRSTRIALSIGCPDVAERLLRWSLGIVFSWFGALKLVDWSPAIQMVRDTYPPFASLPLLCLLTFFEVGVGVMLLTNFWPRLAALLIIFHLLATFGVLLIAPQLAFAPHFPILTINGEFVVKNLVLLAAAFGLLGFHERKRLGMSGCPLAPTYPPHDGGAESCPRCSSCSGWRG